MLYNQQCKMLAGLGQLIGVANKRRCTQANRPADRRNALVNLQLILI